MAYGTFYVQYITYLDIVVVVVLRNLVLGIAI